MPYSSCQNRERRIAPPLNSTALRALALSYAGKYATTQARLARYLERKLRERGWDEDAPVDINSLISQFAELNYVDDENYARTKADSLLRRGFGPGRVKATLHHAGVHADIIATHANIDADIALSAAHDFARRKRLGPYGPPQPDRKASDRALAALMRAGHGFDVARKVLSSDVDLEW
jgi:regulatory protein